MKVLLEGEESMPPAISLSAAASSSRGGGSGCAFVRHCKLLQDLIAIKDLYEDQKLQVQWRGHGVCFDIRRVMGAMVRTYQITMERAYYKCALGLSSTSNVTDTFSHGMVRSRKPPPLVPLHDNSYHIVLLSRHLCNPTWMNCIR